jgi:peptidoglycan hydrolase-like protein with peptidoglycan-binding domain
MRHGARRLLVSLGGVAVVGTAALSLAPMAGASTGYLRVAGEPTARAAAARPAVPYVPSSQTLRFGMHNSAVKALQKRLNYLHYYAGKADGAFGWDTMEAVWAFKEVQSGNPEPSNPDVVGPTMQRLLLHPKLPKVLVRHAHWTRIEVNKDVGVLVVYHGTKIALISHVSSAAYCRPDGCGWVTPDGTYRAWAYDPGCVPDATFGGCLYNPVFFIGTTFAIHGMPNPTSTFSPDGVPLNAASHGCVRIPLDISVFLHTLIHVSSSGGTLIYIIGHDQDDSGI